MRRDHLHHFRNCVTRLASGAVDRVATAPSRRQFRVDLRLQVVGQRQQLQPTVTGKGVACDDSPPAGGREHDGVRALRQRLRGERRRRVERFLHRGRAGDAGLTAHTVEHLVVGGERAGVAGGGTRTTLAGATLDDDEWLARCDRSETFEQRASVDDAFEVRDRDGGRGIVGVPVEIVGGRDGCRVARRDCAADADAGLARVVEEALTKLPLWLATAMRPAGGYGATICAHNDAGVLTRPCPFGPASRMPNSSASVTSSASARRPSSPASP